MRRDRMIGIVGGMGPEAGIDLCRKILSQTLADRDQDHLPMAMISMPAQTEDRTAYVTGRSRQNPGHAIASVIEELASLSAEVVGMPCNTAHAPEIFGVVREKLAGLDLTYVHLIEEVLSFIRTEHPHAKRIGLLCTTGTRTSRAYEEVFQGTGLELILPDEETQAQVVQPAISDETHGVKACAHPVSERARQDLLDAAQWLVKNGAEAVILGCTEIPLAIRETSVAGVPVVDSILVLARALVRESSPGKLRRGSWINHGQERVGNGLHVQHV